MPHFFHIQKNTKYIYLIAFCWALFIVPRYVGASQVLIVNSSSRSPYLDAISGLNEALGGVSYQGVATIQQVESEVVDVDDIQNNPLFNRKIEARQVKVIVAVGSKALAAISDRPLPIVYLMVANPGESIREKKNITGISLRVDPGKQLAAIAKQFTSVTKLGVIYDPDKSAEQIASLKRSSSENNGIDLIGKKVLSAKNVKAALDSLDSEVDALLLLPDTTVLNRANLDIFSLYSLNKKKPLIAFAPQYLKRGASLVIYSTPKAMGEQAGDIVLQLLAGKTFEQLSLIPSQTLTVKTNDRILKKLGFDVATDGGILKKAGSP